MDLTSVRQRAVAHLGWTEDEAVEAEEHYRIFMKAAACLGDPVSPSRKVDEFWHLHILDTKKYRQDCMEHLGKFIEHNPNVQPSELVVPPSVDQFLAQLGKLPEREAVFAATESCDSNCSADAR